MAYYIQDNCVACGKCIVECPVKAIVHSQNGPVIRGDSCISCGMCARVCKEGAPVDLSAEQRSVLPHEPEELTCDVLVIGGGGSGLVAAARAGYGTGLKVILIEKGRQVGGGAWYAADFKVFNSRWQKERGVPDVLEESLRDAMDQTCWKLDAHLARNCYEATGRFFDWLCDTGENVEDAFREGFYIFDGPHGPKIPVYKKQRHGKQGGAGQFVTDQMLQLCKAQSVQVRCSTQAIRLLQREGRLCGALCKDEGGLISIRAKVVIMATGSWIENQTLLEGVDAKFAAMEKVRSPHRSPLYTGDGLNMAAQAGVKLDRESMCLRLMGPVFMPADGTPYAAFGAMAMESSVIFVNTLGKRWIDESFADRGNFFAPAIPLREQPGAISFTIFDTDCVKAMVKRIQAGGTAGPFPAPPVTDDWQNDLDQALKAYGYAFYRADSVAELAIELGIDPLQLEQTVERYNRMCEQGRDTDFCKSDEKLIPLQMPPFYGLRCSMATDGAFGGIPINANTNAFTQQGDPIDNFFVTGDLTSGRFVNQGGVKVQIINDLAWAFASGFMAGSNAAELLRNAEDRA